LFSIGTGGDSVDSQKRARVRNNCSNLKINKLNLMSKKSR